MRISKDLVPNLGAFVLGGPEDVGRLDPFRIFWPSCCLGCRIFCMGLARRSPYALVLGFGFRP